ncbi:ABC transporter permease [Agromyces bracchium]|uniref:FtsX-like permease family protein n=1 Tax=Agromyces bracchium TaxID=88376 RepID=A0A6I3M8H4_9MICO|nr:ABC transporter permease [Agromyces bracchium]MTH69271.1 FtsX-like permease family protein [Agromyces bracchium]
MRTTDVVTNATRNAFRSKLRTTLTVLSLFVGAFTLTLTTALGAGVNDYVSRQVATVSTGDALLVTPAASADSSEGPTRFDPDGRQQSTQPNPLGSGTLLNADDLETMQGIDGIERVEPVRQVVIDWVAPADGTEEDRYELDINPSSSLGRSDLIAGEQLDDGKGAAQIVLQDEYVDALGFGDAESAIGETVELGYTDAAHVARSIEAEVVGIARTSLFASGAGVDASLTDVVSEAQAIPGQPEAYVLAVAHLDGPGGGAVTEEDIRQVKAQLADADLTGQTVEDQLGVIQTVINGIIGVLSAFSVIALLAASFGIVNTLLMSVQERTREIGLMKAMGMSNGRVFSLFSLEAVVIGFLGSAIGALAAIGLGSLISSALAAGPLADLPGLSILLFDPVNVLAVILVIMLVAFVSGVLPARRAARQDPIDSLRYE